MMAKVLQISSSSRSTSAGSSETVISPTDRDELSPFESPYPDSRRTDFTPKSLFTDSPRNSSQMIAVHGSISGKGFKKTSGSLSDISKQPQVRSKIQLRSHMAFLEEDPEFIQRGDVQSQETQVVNSVKDKTKSISKSVSASKVETESKKKRFVLF